MKTTEKKQLELPFEVIGNPSIVGKNKRYGVTNNKGDVEFYTYSPIRDGDFDLLRKGEGTVSGDYYIGVQKAGKDIELFVSLNLIEDKEDKSYLSLHKKIRFNNLAKYVFDNANESSNWSYNGVSAKDNSIYGGTFLDLDSSKLKKWNNIGRKHQHIKDLQVKIGDDGDENKIGNIGIKGIIVIEYTVTTEQKNVSKPAVTQPSAYTKEITEIVDSNRISFRFEIIGETDANVINHPSPKMELKNDRIVVSYGSKGDYKGDNEIYTKEKGKTKAIVNVGIQKTGKNIEIIVLYTVQELQGDRTTLSLSKTFTHANLAHFDTENKDVKRWWELGGNPVHCCINESQTFSGVQKDWLYFDKEKSTILADVHVKLDGSGAETKKGNMGIKGTVYVGYVVKETTKPQLIVEEELAVSATIPTKGSCQKLKSINEKVRNILGCGMYISGQYASTAADSLAEPVMDLDKLNDYQRINQDKNGGTSSYEINKSGSHEYTKKLDTDLTINVSAKYGVCSFSHETKKTFSEDRYNKDTYKFITRKDIACMEQYQIQGAKTPNELCPFLTDNFVKDLNKLSAAKMVEKYGTHVMMGMKLGGRFDYSYSYLQSINNTTIIKTFKTTTSVQANMGEDGKLRKALDYSKMYEQRDKLIAEGKIEEAQKIIEEITKLDETAKKGAGGSGGAGAYASVETSKTETITDNMTDETFESKAFTTGGDHKLCILINGETDLEKLRQYKEEWLRSITDQTASWCDYLSGTLIPIYEFIPDGKRITRLNLEKAYIKYIQENCVSSEHIIGKGIHSYSLRAKGKSDVHRLNSCDREISTQVGKETYWRITLELVNLTGGKIAVAVWYEVHEGGKNAGRSVIQLRQSIEIPVSNKHNIAVDKDAKDYRFTFDGYYVGQMHDWIDVTDQARGCSFIDTDNSKFMIIIDGPGSSDCDDIELKGTLKVPYQYYNYGIKTQ